MEENSSSEVFSYKAHCGSSSARTDQPSSSCFVSELPPKIPSSIGREIATEATNLFFGAKPRIPTIETNRYPPIEAIFFPELQKHEDILRQAGRLLQSEDTKSLIQLARENEFPACRIASYFSSIQKGDEMQSIEAFDILDRTKILQDDLPEYYRVVDYLRQNNPIMVTSPPPLFVLDNSG